MEASGLDLLKTEEFVSPNPDVVPAPAEISMPEAGTFNRCDINVMNLADGKYFAELKYLDQLDSFIEKARSFIPFFYSYRSW